MLKHRRFFIIALCLCNLAGNDRQAQAHSELDQVEQQARTKIYQLNIGIKVRLKDNQFAQLSGLSPTRHYPIFAAESIDRGYRVVGYGTCFPLLTSKHDRTYFFTNKHVIEYGEGMLRECQRFFAAMRLHAEKTAAFSDPESHYKELLRIVSLSARNSRITAMERSVYETAVDAIWSTYDNQLSLQADPKRTRLNKYTKLSGFQGQMMYFIHAPGAARQSALEADLYRSAKSARDPDLAVLAVRAQNIPSLELETISPKINQPVLAVGYPINRQSQRQPISAYVPTFSRGKITDMVSGMVHFDAPVSKGDSGGPLLNGSGKVIGVIARKASPAKREKFAGAISAPTVQQFVPELFSNILPLRTGEPE